MDYFSEHTWSNYDRDGRSSERLSYIRKMIPQKIQTILDAGCGNGLITNELARDYEVTALDPSPVALQYVQCPKVCASIDTIPFPDNSFDLVCCNEVLEHLDDPTLKKGISEIKRVSKKYLIIGVPFKEQLEKKFYRCAVCGFTENVYSHLQSFDLAKLDELLNPDFILLEHHIFGPPERTIHPFLLSILHKQGQWFLPSDKQKCPQCGSNEFLHKSNLLTKLINGFNLIISHSHPYWLYTLYQKKDKI